MLTFSMQIARNEWGTVAAGELVNRSVLTPVPAPSGRCQRRQQGRWKTPLRSPGRALLNTAPCEKESTYLLASEMREVLQREGWEVVFLQMEMAQLCFAS